MCEDGPNPNPVSILLFSVCQSHSDVQEVLKTISIGLVINKLL